MKWNVMNEWMKEEIQEKKNMRQYFEIGRIIYTYMNKMYIYKYV